MRPMAVLGLVGFMLACGGPTSPTLRSQTISGSLSSVGTMAADYRVYTIDAGGAGALDASLRWTGDGDLWIFVFDVPPPTSEPALAQSDQAHPTNPVALRASLPRAGTYYVLVMQSIVPAGPERGACQCTDTFTLVLTYP